MLVTDAPKDELLEELPVVPTVLVPVGETSVALGSSLAPVLHWIVAEIETVKLQVPGPPALMHTIWKVLASAVACSIEETLVPGSPPRHQPEHPGSP
jgi:hypothetical protein